MYGKAYETFYTWGLVNPNVNSRQGVRPEVYLPVVSCEKLIHDLPEWFALWGNICDIVDTFVTDHAELMVKKRALRSAFFTVAASLWHNLQRGSVISCSPMPGNTFFYALGLAKRVQHFNGILILLGKHQNLWKAMKMYYK